MAAEKILVVDDEPGVRSALQAILSDEGFVVATTETGEEGLERARSEAFDAVLLDVWLPGMDGLETLRGLREHDVDAQVVMISGHGTIETAVRATKLGAFDFVEKPLSLEKTLLVLRNALRQRGLERMNRHLLEQLARDTEIVGRSAAAERLRAEVEVAGRSTAPVLICGEPGSGRENIARGLHAAGREPDAPFVDVPCGALDEPAAAAALYGDAGEPGRLDLAAGGSLFLEDVQRLAVPLQRRLAAELERRIRDGSSIRLLASAGPGAAGLDGELRQLLDVIHISVPPLRERREDVPRLAERMLRDLSREYAKPAVRLAPDSLRALQAHSWPGNVRELHNVIERLLLFARGEAIRVRDLPESMGGARGPEEDLYREFASLQEGKRAFENYYVARIMAEENGDVAAAAARLGIAVATLRRRLKLR